MKKFSIVLLALLLAGGFAFAAELALSGEVSSNFKLDFDADEYGFYHDDTNEIDLSFVLTAESAGEGDLYAVIMLEDAELALDTVDADGPATWTGTLGDLSAKVVGPDWEVALSSPTGFGNATAPDMDQDGDTDPEDTIDPGFDNSPNDGAGLTATYQGVSASANFWNDGTNTYYAFSAGYSTELADGVTAGIDLGLDEEDFLGSVTVSYAMDMLTVDAAMDFLIGSATSDDFAFDTSVAATATPVEDVTVDVAAYYEASNEEFDFFGKVAYAGIENVTLSAWGYLNDSNTADPVDGTIITVGQGGSEEDLKAWAAGMDASYAYDIYTPYVSLGYDATEAFSLEVGADVAIIDNAAVNVNYSNDDLANLTGVVNASVTVSL